MMDDDHVYIGLAHLPSFGGIRLRKLIARFGAAERLWRADAADFLAHRIPEKLATQFLRERAVVNVDACMQQMRRLGMTFLTERDDDFPALLREIPDAPIGLFVRGTLPALSLPLAVVGTRRPSSYGRQATRMVVDGLARSGVAVVSGLAMGIDGIAHETTLAAGGGTVAVIASGLDRVYPRVHAHLAESIVRADGVIMTEFPPGTPALRHHFPIRNRIIAGLTRGTLVTEAPEKSGALLTAMLALEYNRDVFAVPGPVTLPSARGTNALIRSGAQLVESAADVLAAYHLRQTAMELPVADLTATERTVAQAMPYEPVTADDVATRSGIAPSVVNATLTLLQMKGWVEQQDPLHYTRLR